VIKQCPCSSNSAFPEHLDNGATDSYSVVCKDCGKKGKGKVTIRQAVDAWNSDITEILVVLTGDE